jgi:molybdate transport system substrate-binding protein
MRRFWLAAILAITLNTTARAADLVVFAAASLTDALKDLAPLWEKQSGDKLQFSFAASSTLARQLDQGAPANLFMSADQKWMDWAQDRALIANASRRNLLGNALVLVMPKDSLRPVVISKSLDLASLLGSDGRIATGDPSNVPAGMYAKEALTKLGLWDIASPRIAGSDSVRSALLLVERHEAPLGIVYATDAAVAPNVAIAGVFPADSHSPIIYPCAVTKTGDTAQARKFLDFLAGPEAQAVFIKRGFTVLSAPAQPRS